MNPGIQRSTPDVCWLAVGKDGVGFWSMGLYSERFLLSFEDPAGINLSPYFGRCGYSDANQNHDKFDQVYEGVLSL